MAADCLLDWAVEAAAQMAPEHPLQFIPHTTNCSRHEEEKRDSQFAGVVTCSRVILATVFRRVDEVLSNSTLMEQLQQLAPSIDIMVNDIVSYGMLVANKLNLQYVDVDVGAAGALYEPVFFGAEPGTSFVPAMGTFFSTTGMAFWQRVANLAVAKITRGVVSHAYWHPRAGLQTIIKKHNISMSWPYVHAMMLLVNSNWNMEPPRAVAPNTKYIGPVLPQPAAALPRDLADWLCQGPASAAAGNNSTAAAVVLVAFGNTLQPPLGASRTLIRVFESMPETRFVWKLSAEDQVALQDEIKAAGLSRNVYISAWLPQNDLLGHPRVKAFVTQGGYLSMAEAAYHAVPVVGMPFIIGQGELVRFAQDQGRAILMPASALLRGDAAAIAAALQQAMANSSFASSAAIVSQRLRAVPRPHADMAAEAVEYAAAVKHHGPFLHTGRMRQYWWQQEMLDVVLLYCVVAGLAAWLLWRLSSSCARLLLCVLMGQLF